MASATRGRWRDATRTAMTVHHSDVSSTARSSDDWCRRHCVALSSTRSLPLQKNNLRYIVGNLSNVIRLFKVWLTTLHTEQAVHLSLTDRVAVGYTEWFVAEGRLALMLGMYQKEGLGRERATVERRRRQAVGGTNKLSGGASVRSPCSKLLTFSAQHIQYDIECAVHWKLIIFRVESENSLL